MKFIAALLVIFIILFVYYWVLPSERFNIPKAPSSEYIPQNMSVSEFRTINKWDYPSYLNSKLSENFSAIYPGGRSDLDCNDADYVGVSPSCTFDSNDYIY